MILNTFEQAIIVGQGVLDLGGVRFELGLAVVAGGTGNVVPTNRYGQLTDE